MSLDNVEKLIKDHKVEFVDLRFVDMRGIEQHVTFPVSIVDASLFEDGKMFDGSSISGWKGINESDMVLLPDPTSAYIDPFYADPTLVLVCDTGGRANRALAVAKKLGYEQAQVLGGGPKSWKEANPPIAKA